MKREAKAVQPHAMKILVVGASGGTGRQVVRQLLAAGHRVTAFARTAAGLDIDDEQLCKVDGDALEPEDLRRVMPGHDAVVVTLGISQNPFLVRLLGRRHRLIDVRSSGTRNVIEAMAASGVQRLIVQSSFGVGSTRDLLRLVEKLMFGLVLKPQISDTEKQEKIVRDSSLQWTIVQPVHLSNGDSKQVPCVSAAGGVRRMQVTRSAVAQYIASAVAGRSHLGQSVVVSG